MQTKDRQTEHWLFGPISRQKAKISQLVIASIAINIFALISAFYILTVYDRVIPNETTDSLIYLTAGMVAVIIFDFLMKVIRGVLTDEAGIEVDKEVADSLFNHLSRNENFIGTKTTGSISTTVKEFDSLKDIMASATLVALADLPFILIFLIVLYLIGGPIAAVPALIVVFVIVVGLLIQPVIRKMSASAANDGKSKQSVLIEMLSGLETLKTLKGIPIIKNRWTDSVKNQGEVLLKSDLDTISYKYCSIRTASFTSWDYCLWGFAYYESRSNNGCSDSLCYIIWKNSRPTWTNYEYFGEIKPSAGLIQKPQFSFLRNFQREKSNPSIKKR